MLVKPRYLEEFGIVDDSIAADVPRSYREIGKLKAAIAKLSFRAGTALALGCAEWATWQLGTIAEYGAVFHNVEAIWASLIDDRYLHRWRVDEETHPIETTGTINGKIDLGALRAYGEAHPREKVMFEVNYLFQSILVSQSNVTPTNYLHYVVQLARSVQPDKKPFNRWFKQTIARLGELYPMTDWDGEDVSDWKRRKPIWDGRPVPREALDPDIEFTHEMADDFLSAYLAKLDHKSNPHLNSPKRMLELGFEGTPYTWPSK